MTQQTSGRHGSGTTQKRASFDRGLKESEAGLGEAMDFIEDMEEDEVSGR